jgi:hypothetical protein
MAAARRLVKKAVVIVFFAGIALGSSAATSEEATPSFPSDPPSFYQDGDIILTLSRNMSAAPLQLLGRPAGPYTHAEVYIVTQDGGKIVSFNNKGLSIKDPKEFPTNDFFRLALVRLKKPSQHGQLAQALAILKERDLKFDYMMRWPATDSSTTYCAGAISQLFRLAGLPDPFPLSTSGTAEIWDSRTKELFDIDLTQTVSPNAPLYSKDFNLVAEYKKGGKGALLDLAIYRTIVEKMRAYIFDQRLNPRTNWLEDKIVLGLADMGLTLEDIPLDKLTEKQRQSFFAFYEFMLAVNKRVVRTLGLNQDQNWTEKDVAALTAGVADGYRDSYFFSEKTQ